VIIHGTILIHLLITTKFLTTNYNYMTIATPGSLGSPATPGI
jgi:hypothetical protein